MKRLIVIVVGLCFAGVIGATLVGPTLGDKLFPSKWTLGYRDMFLLTLGATMFIIALTLAQGLIALKSYKQNAIAWILGIVSFMIPVALITGESNLLLRNELGFVAGGFVAAFFMAIFLTLRMRRGGGTLEDLVEVVEHEPLEI
jgi:hypothetical protein